MGLGRLDERLRGADQYPFEAVVDFIVPETEHAIAFRFDPPGTSFIFLDLRSMLTAIEFDDKSGGAVEEVTDITGNRHLAAEFEAIQPSVAETLPELAFDIGGIIAKAFGKTGGTRPKRRNAHPSIPSRMREGKTRLFPLFFHPASRAFTSPLALAMSIWPAWRSLRAAITRPISLTEDAPISVAIASIAALASASSI